MATKTFFDYSVVSTKDVKITQAHFPIDLEGVAYFEVRAFLLITQFSLVAIKICCYNQSTHISLSVVEFTVIIFSQNVCC